MQALAGRAARAPGLPLAAEEFREAATALAGARDGWVAVTRLWQVITTDTQEAVSPVTVDASDLVLRMGRLVSGMRVHHAVDAVEVAAHADADADGVRRPGRLAGRWSAAVAERS